MILGKPFNGYYCYNSVGRINETGYGLIRLNLKASNGKVLNGWYYRDDRSLLAPQGSIRYINKKVGNKQFSGYYYFGTDGKMDTMPGIHKLNTVYKGSSYKGYYCFAGTEGKMIRKKGLVTMGETYYYVMDTTGKCLVNAKKKIDGFSYSFSANGKGVRTSTKLGGLKSRLTALTNGYGGTWSIYVKKNWMIRIP